MSKAASTKPMTCKQVLTFFKKPERLHRTSLPHEVKAHVKTCPSCTKRLATLRATLTVFGTRVNVQTPTAIRRYVEKRLSPHRTSDNG